MGRPPPALAAALAGVGRVLHHEAGRVELAQVVTRRAAGLADPGREPARGGRAVQPQQPQQAYAQGVCEGAQPRRVEDDGVVVVSGGQRTPVLGLVGHHPRLAMQIPFAKRRCKESLHDGRIGQLCGSGSMWTALSTVSSPIRSGP